MNPFPKRIFLTFFIGILIATACGPFFPDTVLTLPQAALRVKATCMLDEIVAIDQSLGRGLTKRSAGQEMIRRSQSSPVADWRMSNDDYKRNELKKSIKPVIAAGLPEELAMNTFLVEGATRTEAIELAIILLDKNVKSDRVAEIVTGLGEWRKSLPELDLDGPWNISIPTQTAIPLPPEYPEVPADITAYWKAAKTWRSGDLATARAEWQAILNLPEKDHKNRAVWAAWMLAKTSPDQEAAIPFYQKTISLTENGYHDVLGLSPLAMGWLAITETDPVARLKWYFEAACSGNEDMLISLRRQLDPILADESAMTRAAEDPLSREIVTALLFIMYHNPETPSEHEDKNEDAWLSLLEKKLSNKPSPAAAKAAWICYSRAEFDAARRWLAQAPSDAGEVLWLKAKLALRDGKLDEAAQLFAKAAPLYQFAAEEQPAEPSLCDIFWYDPAKRRDWMKGQFYSDRAIVHIGRGEFLRAMDFLVKASYTGDAAYLAERVLTTDELVTWVKNNRPAPKVDIEQESFLILEDGTIHLPDGQWQSDRLRYLLARRLAREFRFSEAAEFMPHALSSVFDYYVHLHRASREPSISKESKAVILWNLAYLRRHLGMEMFGYEGAPDLASWDGAYEGADYLAMRSQKTGWQVGEYEWNQVTSSSDPSHFAIPAISREETKRIAPHLADKKPRFHYRYDAAEIAWRAAALLPDNDPRTFYILHEGGRWLAPRDPKAANRFYLEIIRRCPELPVWQEINRLHWFLPESPENPLPELPEGLRFTMPDLAVHH